METKIEGYKKEVEDLKATVEEQRKQIDETNGLFIDQAKEIANLTTNPPDISQELIDSKVQEALTQHQLENFWQRKLDETQTQLVFKNLKKTPATAQLHPRQIFQDYILTPMNLDHEDNAKATPISVIDANKDKADQASHLLIATFSSLQAIAIIKQNARKIPKTVKFNPRVPPQFQPTLNGFLRTQGQLRQLRDRDGSTLVKSRLNSDRGHILLEVSDKIGEGWSPFYTKAAYMPQSKSNLPQTSTHNRTPKYTLLQYKWETPPNTAAQNNLKNLLSTLNLENSSFNPTNHVLNITVMHSLENATREAIARNPHASTSKCSCGPLGQPVALFRYLEPHESQT